MGEDKETSNKKSHKCEDCDYKNEEKSALQVHIAESHGKGNLYKCEDCGYKTARDKYTMKRHIKLRHGKEDVEIEPIKFEPAKSVEANPVKVPIITKKELSE